MNKINNLEKWFLFVLAISITLIVWLFLVDSTDDKTLLWARYTARISFFFFTVSFLASSIHYFLSNSLTSFIRNNRRHIGLSFALAHTIHLVALTSFFVTANLTIATSATVVTASEDRGLVTDSSTQNSSIHTTGNDAGAITDNTIAESDDFGSI